MSWGLLPVSSNTSPTLLVRSHFDKDGYSVRLTDLSRIWAETITKDEIIQRATDYASSIDPSEDEEQFQILIDKVTSALKGEIGTSLHISTGDGATTLRLELTAPLPRPLPPFKWNVHLQLQPNDRIAAELVTPLILQASRLQRNVQLLVDQLHDKDRVISKVCDRLETSGNDLTTVFPGVSNIKTSRKKGQREQLAKHVKGLSDFDEDDWSSQNGVFNDDVKIDAEILKHVFADLPNPPSLHAPGPAQKWWEQIIQSRDKSDGGEAADPKEKLSSFADSQPKKSFDHAMGGKDRVPVGDSQQRSAPHEERGQQSHPRSPGENDERRPAADASTSQQSSVDIDSSTDDEDDLDAPTYKLNPTAKQSSGAAQKLGAIGGYKSAPVGPEGTASAETDGTTKPRIKLGAIGGKPPRSDAETASSHREDTTTKASASTRGSKLGAIGGQPIRTPAQAAAMSPQAAATVSPRIQLKESAVARKSPVETEKTKSPSPEVTAEEAADLKRDRLKRELEEKAKAPVKKKRKF